MKDTIRQKGINYHRTELAAMIELANKKHPRLWRIDTINGWYVVIVRRQEKGTQ